MINQLFFTDDFFFNLFSHLFLLIFVCWGLKVIFRFYRFSEGGRYAPFESSDFQVFDPSTSSNQYITGIDWRAVGIIKRGRCRSISRNEWRLVYSDLRAQARVGNIHAADILYRYFK